MFKKEGRSESGTTLIATNCELVGDVHFSDELLVSMPSQDPKPL
jgi:hypothetical protein